MTAVARDPYRDWLRARLSPETGVGDAEQVIEEAAQRRGWPAQRVLGPRDVVALMQDIYALVRALLGDPAAERWVEAATLDLATFAQSVPVPSQPVRGEIAPVLGAGPVRWGRRAHDLPLLLARSHAEIAGRSLEAIRANPDLSPLEDAAEWDMQATQAEVRRWETEEVLSSLRADHARVEVADQVAVAAAQAEVLHLTVRELEQLEAQGQPVGPRLAHTRLMSQQTDAFLASFSPLIRLDDADSPVEVPMMDLSSVRYSLGVPLHPAVLRARSQLNYARWQSGDQATEDPAVQQARAALAQAEHEAQAQLNATLSAARAHQRALEGLIRQVALLEKRVQSLRQTGRDKLGVARVVLEWRQTRSAARVQAHRLQEAASLLDALISDNDSGR
ncbi:hypothetical protein DEDE109153_02805 [Deinococcus deserti]|uniref:Uncharacterized protein n=1 Tax=Deinococcus deserti (strain DSM 17065 / CIP 109153 / LMG 22923 / VCD115) TaxID=546414 RepID=C1CUQ1_DEIDV|nr:hypothetical protein [Deinococcus deserti]ACO45918.1 hypothetical protein Deide_10330 [Deinococcus deserti VCD115]